MAIAPTLLEYQGSRMRTNPCEDAIVAEPLALGNGFILLNDAPGIGVELREDAAELNPYKPRAVQTRRHVDGSVLDQ